MKLKTEIQKGFVKVKINGPVDHSLMDIVSEEKVVGRLFTRHDNYAIAFLKFKYRSLALRVGDATLEFVERF